MRTLQILLGIAIAALFVQLFAGHLYLLQFDVRNWSRPTWLTINAGIVLALIGIRFAPDLYHDWRERRARRAIERAKHDKQRQLKEQRELLQRLQEARKRQVI